jgi:hypothetical protein
MNEAWIAIKNEYETIANQHSTLAAKMNSDIYQPLLEQIKEEKKNRSSV